MIKKCVIMFVFLCFGMAFYAEVAPAAVKWEYGAMFRLRQEYYENVFDLETGNKVDRDFLRRRNRLCSICPGISIPRTWQALIAPNALASLTTKIAVKVNPSVSILDLRVS